MAGLFGKLKSLATSVLDPDAESRTANAAREVELKIKEQRDAFDLRGTLERLQIYAEDRKQIIEKVYDSFLTRAWRDYEISPNEAAALDWVAKKIGLATDQRAKLDHAAGSKAFANCFLAALSNDSRLDDKEIAVLARIAAVLQTTPGAILQQSHSSETTKLFEGMLHVAIPGGRVNATAWTGLRSTIDALGIGLPAFQRMIAPAAKNLVEAALTNAQSDGVVADAEVQEIEWLLANLVDDSAWSRYVFARLHRIVELQQIRAGALPSIRVDHAGVRAGEIVHLAVASNYLRSRQLKNEVRHDQFSGSLVVTDSRLIFVSQLQTHSVSHSRVELINFAGSQMSLQCVGKGTGVYTLGNDPELAAMIYDVAVRRSNQTIVQKVDSSPTRHIPREVRQRVWQRYGGKCADCQATEYLEFDHIVPFAKAVVTAIRMSNCFAGDATGRNLIGSDFRVK